ncbi:MAG: pseudouridine synthase [Clostridia bacterium]|jgi:pseudouridine synthase|nr:pseudouridine synthase [Clostridia bacterium]MDD4665964.1 pseudouridine synthase [Clostridia bacterium]
MVVGKLERLQKYLARCGIASRRKAEEMIRQGLVKVNEQIVSEMGFQIEPGKDRVEVQGKKVEPEKRKVYFLLNKPGGVVTTLDDPQGRAKVTDLLKGVAERVYPVGRLDYQSEGLLLLTNDGELAYRLTHPRFEIAKTYLAKVQGQVKEQAVERLQKGVELEDGLTQPALVKIRQRGLAETLLEITIKEGRNRQVRRMCEKIGHSIISLKRIKLGPLALGNLQTGQYRELKQKEIQALKKACALE